MSLGAVEVRREDIQIVSRAFDSVCALFWGEVKSAIDVFVRGAGELCDGGRGEATGFAEPRFRYHFWQRPAIVRLRWMLCDPQFPRVVGGLRRHSHDSQCALDQIEVHRRRIRRDFQWRIGQSVEAICAHAAQQVLSAIDGLETALKCGANLRWNAIERGAQLIAASTELLRLEAKVRAIPWRR
jgi:hypothetical protein